MNLLSYFSFLSFLAWLCVRLIAPVVMLHSQPTRCGHTVVFPLPRLARGASPLRTLPKAKGR